MFKASRNNKQLDQLIKDVDSRQFFAIYVCVVCVCVCVCNYIYVVSQRTFATFATFKSGMKQRITCAGY